MKFDTKQLRDAWEAFEAECAGLLASACRYHRPYMGCPLDDRGEGVRGGPRRPRHERTSLMPHYRPDRSDAYISRDTLCADCDKPWSAHWGFNCDEPYAGRKFKPILEGRYFPNRDIADWIPWLLPVAKSWNPYVGVDARPYTNDDFFENSH